MCGISGFVNLQSSDHIISYMLKTMRRRGPDANGYAVFNRCTLLHSRLSIIDPDGGKQPMELHWGNETYTITYNGELYNTPEVKDALIALGHHFKTCSDTEVILHAYAQWKERCVDNFNGIFAFAVWEHRRERLFLARDRMGVKPLFYHLHNDGIIFASELKTILSYPTVSAAINTTGICEIVLLGPGRTPGCGVFKDFLELEPGCFGYYEKGKWFWSRYWKLTDKEHTETFEETARYVKYLVTDAIKRQMVSDVPVGTFLSGGLDSSLISSVCAKEMEKQGLQLPTFSVDYDNNEQYFSPGKFQPSSDSQYIRLMQAFLNSQHSWTILSPDDLAESLQDATCARDLPGMADVDSSLLLLCRHIRNNVKVALSGECADEIFGGYPWYRDPQIRSIDGFPWSQNIAKRISLLNDGIIPEQYAYDYVQDRYQETICDCDILPGTPSEERRMKEMMVLNIRWFMQTLLDRKDRMSMYNGLEVRVPFCDHRIAEYLYCVPWSYKNFEGREKGLLRYAMAEYLPLAVLHRKKSPYPKTFDPRYLELMKEKLKHLLLDSNAPIFEIIKKEVLISLLEAPFTQPWYGQLMGTPQTIAFMLQLNYWLEHYNVDILL